MKSIYFNRLGRVFVAAILAVAAFEFLPDAMAIVTLMPNDMISTNTVPRGVPRRASIIFIQVDRLGYGDLSCYGQTNFQTPNLDKLAAGGIRFTNYSAADTSSLSQAALMMGENSGQQHQHSHMDMLVTPDEINIAQVLKNSGYHTGLIGEWELGDENSASAPWRKGFDEFAGYLNSKDAENFYAEYIYRYAPGEILNRTNNAREDYLGREELYPNTQGKNEYIPDVLTKAALNFVQNNLPDQFNHFRPFFLLLDYKIPGGKIEVPTDAPFSEEPWPQPEKNKAALVSRIDGYAGELQEQLQKIGMTNNVVIFFSSGSVPKKTAEIDPDFFHSNISTNDLRVPMIVHWTGTIPVEQVSGYKWSPEDFLPTAAQIAFTQSPTNIDGTSVLPELLGRTRK
jgi:arylsulfatase A-like enzyme